MGQQWPPVEGQKGDRQWTSIRTSRGGGGRDKKEVLQWASKGTGRGSKRCCNEPIIGISRGGAKGHAAMGQQRGPADVQKGDSSSHAMWQLTTEGVGTTEKGKVPVKC